MLHKINIYSLNKKNEAQWRKRLRNKNYPRTLKIPCVPISFPVVTKIKNFNHSHDFCDGPLCIFLNTTLLNFALFLLYTLIILYVLFCDLHFLPNTLFLRFIYVHVLALVYTFLLLYSVLLFECISIYLSFYSWWYLYCFCFSVIKNNVLSC